MPEGCLNRVCFIFPIKTLSKVLNSLRNHPATPHPKETQNSYIIKASINKIKTYFLWFYDEIKQTR
jgi:hypothetical protein